MKGHYGHAAGAMWGRRARHWKARMWLHENPSTDELIAMLEEYQRDLEQEVANVADRIRELKESQEA